MIFSSVDGFLRSTLSFSIFSSSFIIFCFLFSLFVPCGLFDLFLCCRVPPLYSFILYLFLFFHYLLFPVFSFCPLWSFWSFPLLPGSSALLFHSLSVPLLSLSFVSCFLFLFPVVVLCFFNPFSLSISFHFFPLSLFCFSILSALLSLSLPPLLYSFSSFSILGCRVAGSPGCRVAGSPGRRVAGLPGCRVAGSPGRRVAGSPGCRVPLLLFPQAFRSVSGSVLWK